MKRLALLICCTAAAGAYTAVFSQDKPVVAPVQPVAAPAKSTQNAKSSEAGIRAGLQTNSRLLPPGVNVNAAVYEQYKKSGTVSSNGPLTPSAPATKTAGINAAGEAGTQASQKAGINPADAGKTTTLPNPVGTPGKQATGEASGYSKLPPPALYTQSAATPGKSLDAADKSKATAPTTGTSIAYGALPADRPNKATGAEANGYSKLPPPANYPQGASGSNKISGINENPGAAEAKGKTSSPATNAVPGYGVLPAARPNTTGAESNGYSKPPPPANYPEGASSSNKNSVANQNPGATSVKGSIATAGTGVVPGYGVLPEARPNPAPGTNTGAPAVAGYDKVPPAASNGTIPGVAGNTKQGPRDMYGPLPPPGQTNKSVSGTASPGSNIKPGTGASGSGAPAVAGYDKVPPSASNGTLPAVAGYDRVPPAPSNGTLPKQNTYSTLPVSPAPVYDKVNAGSLLPGTAELNGQGQKTATASSIPNGNQSPGSGNQYGQLPARREANASPAGQPVANGTQGAQGNRQYEAISSPIGGTQPAQGGGTNQYGSLTLKPATEAVNPSKTIYTKAPLDPSAQAGTQGSNASSNAALKAAPNNQYGSLTLTPSGQAPNASQNVYTRAPQQSAAEPGVQGANASPQAGNAALKAAPNSQYGSLTLSPAVPKPGSQTQPLTGSAVQTQTALKATSSSAGALPANSAPVTGGLNKLNAGLPPNNQYSAPPVTGPTNTKANVGATQQLSASEAANKNALEKERLEKEKLEKERLQKQRRRSH